MLMSQPIMYMPIRSNEVDTSWPSPVRSPRQQRGRHRAGRSHARHVIAHPASLVGQVHTFRRQRRGDARSRPERADVVRGAIALVALDAVPADGCVHEPRIPRRQQWRSRVRPVRARRRVRWSRTRRLGRRSCAAMRRPSSRDRFSPTLRLLRLSSSNGGLEPSPPKADSSPRKGSPSGGSILTTSAPQSPSTAAADGPATHMPTSTTRMPSIGPGTSGAYADLRFDPRHGLP